MHDPREMDWGAIHVDFYRDEGKIAVHLFNHDLSPPNVELNLRFARGRLRHFAHHLPPGTVQWVIFDDRGQDVPEDSRRLLRSGLAGYTSAVLFTSEG
jgi:hypothetical protein